jgi:hypothetical protein
MSDDVIEYICEDPDLSDRFNEAIYASNDELSDKIIELIDELPDSLSEDFESTYDIIYDAVMDTRDDMPVPDISEGDEW